MDVGWIGTGRMGTAMAERLFGADVALTVWNRTPAKAEPLRERGAAVAGSLAELRGAPIVFTMVADDAALEAVLTGDGGLLAGDRVPDVIVDCSTVSPEGSAAVRRACAERGAAFLAAPVSGNPGAVRAGRLAIAVSGPRDAYDRAAPLLARIAGSVTYMGDGDSARLVKIAHNLLLGVLTQALAEVSVLAEKGGVPRHALLDFLNNSVLGSVFTRYKTPAFVKLDFTPTFTPPLLKKDFDLGLTAADGMDVPMPVVEQTARLIQSLVEDGHVDEDFAVLLTQQAAAAGLKLAPEKVDVDDGLQS